VALYRETLTAGIGSKVIVLVIIVIIVIIIGGLGSIGGCFLGSILVAQMANHTGYLTPKVALASNDLLHPDRWLLWLGVLFVLSVYFFPAGIVG